MRATISVKRRRRQGGITTLEYAVAGALISVAVVASYGNLGLVVGESIGMLAARLGGGAPVPDTGTPVSGGAEQPGTDAPQPGDEELGEVSDNGKPGKRLAKGKDK